MASDQTTEFRCRDCLCPAAAPGLCESCAAYQPPRTGIHICGSNDVEDYPITLASFPMTETLARDVFERLKEFEEPDHDVIIDLFIGDDRPDDIGIRT